MPVFDDVSWPVSGRWIRANILFDAHGNVTGPDGTSASLTRGRDRELLRQLRADADVVVVGGASVRAEGWFFPPHGEIVVVSQSGDVPIDVAAHPDRIIVVSSIENLTSALETLDADHVVCEAGPRLLNELLEHDVVDELYISVVTEAESMDEHSVTAVTPEILVKINDFDLTEQVIDSDVSYSRFLRRRVIPRGTDSAR